MATGTDIKTYFNGAWHDGDLPTIKLQHYRQPPLCQICKAWLHHLQGKASLPRHLASAVFQRCAFIPLRCEPNMLGRYIDLEVGCTNQHCIAPTSAQPLLFR